MKYTITENEIEVHLDNGAFVMIDEHLVQAIKRDIIGNRIHMTMNPEAQVHVYRLTDNPGEPHEMFFYAGLVADDEEEGEDDEGL